MSGSDLPGVLGEIAEEVGETAAIKLARARGGTAFEIPRRIAGSELEKIVGAEDGEAIIRLLGHGRVKLPMGGARGMGRRRARAAKMLQEGASLQQVALAEGYDIRSVERIKRELKLVDPSQPKLPFDNE